jgi:hypothetical protein
MSPRIIHIPLSGGDRKAQAKGIRYAHGIHESAYRESVLIRSAAEAKIREADRLECEAWNAIMWAGGPAMPSPGDPQAEPTIGKAINGGFDLLEAKCNRCDRVPTQAVRKIQSSAIGVCRSVRNTCGHYQLKLSASDDRKASTAAIATNTRRHPASFAANSYYPAPAQDCNRVVALTFNSDRQKPCRRRKNPAGVNRPPRALRPTSPNQAKSFYPAALSAAVFEQIIAPAIIRENSLEFHGLGADYAGHKRCERTLVIIHCVSNSLRNRSFLPSRSRCPRIMKRPPT